VNLRVEGALADAALASNLGEQQRACEPRLDAILRAVRGVAEVVAVPQHGASLLLVPVAAGVDHHLAGDSRGGGRPVPDGDQVQGQVEAAGDPGGGGDPAVDDEERPAGRCPRLPGRPASLGR
jgi:hypothetical protein